MQGIDSLWFIPCFFFSELFCVASIMSRKSKIVAGAGGVLIIAYIILFVQNMPEHWILCLVIKITVCFVFIYIGYWIGRSKIIKRMPISVSIFFLILEIILLQMNGGVGIGGLQFQNGILFFMNAIIACVAILSIFYQIDYKLRLNLNILSYFGRDSIVILCTNNLLIELIRLIDYKMTGNILLELGLLGCVIFWLILIIAEAGLIKLAQGKWGILVGKRKC